MDGDRYERLLRHLPCGVLVLADDGTIGEVNDTLLELLGYARGEVEGRHVETLLTVGSRIFYQTHLFPLLRMGGRAEEIFLTLRPRNGDGDVGVLLNAARREHDGTASTVCVLLPVWERRKFEDALLRAKQEAERATTALAARNEELERANAQLEEQALELEMQHQRLHEQAAELEVQQDELQRVNDALLAHTEELEKQRAAADEANRAKSEFLAVMSHELRTPLNAIIGYAELLAMGIPGAVTEAQRAHLGRIELSGRHLLRLINELLNLARIEAGHVEFMIEPVRLPDVVAAMLPMVEPQMATHGLRCEVRVGGNDGLAPPVARADREKLQQILLNLIGNAIKFTPSGGTITVDDGAGLAPRPDVVLLRVLDTGVGIPSEKLERIFEPFVQVDASHTRRAEGAGLGLAISRQLARGMGGDLTAASREGVGSTFTLTLPRAVAENATTPRLPVTRPLAAPP